MRYIGSINVLVPRCSNGGSNLFEVVPVARYVLGSAGRL